jgi:hypothetical protein
MQSQNLVASRAEVYAAIDSERAYQETLARNDVTDQRPLEQLALIRQVLAEIDHDWYYNPGQVDMDKVRKIAGIAVRCMAQHGAPGREL